MQRESGSWWTEDAFYAASCAIHTGIVYTMRISRGKFQSMLDEGALVRETYRERNQNESEYRFTNSPQEPTRMLTDEELKLITSQLKITPVSGTFAIKRLFSGSGIKKSRELFIDISS